MGTRSEIVVWDGHTMVTLYKHWDGYPDYMVPFLKDAANFAAYMANKQRHWLTYAEDVASYLILFHGLVNIYQLRGLHSPTGINTDIRPASGTADLVNYVYMLHVNPTNQDSPEHNALLYWLLEVFSIQEKDVFWNLSREERDKAYLEHLRSGTEIPYLMLRDQIKIEIPVKGLRERVPLTVSVRRNKVK
ncbi:hypothetical protein [Thermofilum sp.]|jgi:hypothetical protein|uniref:hypothetical protein n=1 Tax=Thermofilum sp. TaxID=1961369 RepID=UPI00258F0991|nr:hypothetical protein [Thermofilum sp.]